MDDYDKLYEEHMQLQNNFSILDSEHQKALLKIEKYRESLTYGTTFEFEDGNTMFIPVFGISRGLKANGERPIKYQLNFNESTMVDWIYQLDMTLKKNQK